MILDDEEFIERFETGELSGDDFHHTEHVRLAWLLLRQHSLLAALGRFSEGLKRFAASKGKANLYHETITWAYFFLIHERMKRGGQEQSWQEFAETNSDLLEWKSSILKRYYSDEILFSDFAREIFTFPDKIASQSLTRSEIQQVTKEE